MHACLLSCKEAIERERVCVCVREREREWDSVGECYRQIGVIGQWRIYGLHLAPKHWECQPSKEIAYAISFLFFYSSLYHHLSISFLNSVLFSSSSFVICNLFSIMIVQVVFSRFDLKLLFFECSTFAPLLEVVKLISNEKNIWSIFLTSITSLKLLFVSLKLYYTFLICICAIAICSKESVNLTPGVCKRRL
jgi:hypothetical protein